MSDQTTNQNDLVNPTDTNIPNNSTVSETKETSPDNPTHDVSISQPSSIPNSQTVNPTTNVTESAINVNRDVTHTPNLHEPTQDISNSNDASSTSASDVSSTVLDMPERSALDDLSVISPQPLPNSSSIVNDSSPSPSTNYVPSEPAPASNLISQMPVSQPQPNPTISGISSASSSASQITEQATQSVSDESYITQPEQTHTHKDSSSDEPSSGVTTPPSTTDDNTYLSAYQPSSLSPNPVTPPTVNPHNTDPVTQTDPNIEENTDNAKDDDSGEDDQSPPSSHPNSGSVPPATPTTSSAGTASASQLNSSTNQDLGTKGAGKYSVKVIADKCIGAASCVALAPKAFKLNDEQVAEILETVSGETDENLLLAAQSCPVLAIEVFDNDTGQRVWPK